MIAVLKRFWKGLKDWIDYYLVRFFKDHGSIFEIIAALVFVAIFCFLRYNSSFISDLWAEAYWAKKYWQFHFILYLSPLLIGYLMSSFAHGKWSNWKSPKFWFLCLFGVGIFALRGGLSIHMDAWLTQFKSYEHFDWLRSVVALVARILLILIPFWFYWFFVDRKNQPYYGFSLKNFSTKPYFVMLALMVPLIALASTQGDFLSSYPRGQKINSLDIHTVEHWKYFGLYEFVYGMDFISIEFFFRGFLVLAFVGVVGPRAIIPMAYFYVVIHWNKPMGELISSFFGGTILGIVSYYGKSIIGGIIVHMGIAWLMEIGALVSKYLSTR